MGQGIKDGQDARAQFASGLVATDSASIFHRRHRTLPSVFDQVAENYHPAWCSTGRCASDEPLKVMAGLISVLRRLYRLICLSS